MEIKALIEDKLKGSIKDSSREELYVALVELVKDLCEGKRQEDGKKRRDHTHRRRNLSGYQPNLY